MAGKRQAPDQAADVQRILSILRKWGIHTIGTFAALNKEEISARLGPEGVRLWERANGCSTRLLKLIDPPESFEESFEFEHEVETSEPVLFILRRFLQQLGARLNAIYLVSEQLILRMTFANRQNYERHFQIPQPTNDVDLLFRVLHTHLENFRSEHPIIAASLESIPAKPSSQQFGLFETALRNPARLSETLARLIALLGEDRVGTPVLEETHRPDVFRMKPFEWNLETATDHLSRGERCARVSEAVRESARIALRRFRPNISGSVSFQKKRPIYLQNRQIGGPISNRKGPYRTSGNWWDEKAWAHAEWDMEVKSIGVLRCREENESWRIDGIYD